MVGRLRGGRPVMIDGPTTGDAVLSYMFSSVLSAAPVMCIVHISEMDE